MEEIKEAVPQTVELINCYRFPISQRPLEHLNECFIRDLPVGFPGHDVPVPLDEEVLVALDQLLHQEGLSGLAPAVDTYPFLGFADLIFLSGPFYYNHSKYNGGYTYKHFGHKEDIYRTLLLPPCVDDPEKLGKAVVWMLD